MNVLIVEDEALAAERLIELIRKTDASINILEHFDTVDETVKFFEKGEKTDLLFLDIQLADGKCFSIFEQVKVEVPIIFTTAYDQYALQAFKLHSIDYLLKPIQQIDIKVALEKFKRITSPILGDAEINLLKSLLSQSNQQYKQRYVVKAGNKLQYKPVNEIAYFFADGKMVYLVTKKESRKHLLDQTLEEIERQLDPHDFFRISRKVILNIEAIGEVKGLVSTRMEVKLNQPCEVDLTISRERSQSFKDWLNQ